MKGTPIDLDKLRSIGVLGRGRTRDKVADVRDAAGRAIGKATTDQLGNTTTVRDERQDVLIRAPHVELTLAQKEVRHEPSR